MSNERRFKKGDILFQEGQATDKIYLLQSGRVMLYLKRGNQRIELEEVGAGQVLGDNLVFTNSKISFNVEALAETRVLEMPLSLLKTQVEQASPGLKILLKSMSDESKRQRTYQKNHKMENDGSPCPQKVIPKVFSILSLAGFRVGKTAEISKDIPEYKQQEIKKSWPKHFSEEDIIVSWNSIKVYSNRMFLESIVRTLGVLDILEKLALATLYYVKDEESEEEILHEIRFHGLQQLELFAEFYQYNLYKPGKSESIYVDTQAMQLAGAFVEITRDMPRDRSGVVRIEYAKLIEQLKNEYNIELKSPHLTNLEKKGLFVKRSTVGETVFMAFDYQEYESTFMFWSLIYELDQWNETGHIDKKKVFSLKNKPSSQGNCSDCGSDLVEGAKFCMNCGAKLSSAA